MASELPTLFVATRPEDVPPGRVLSVDGSVPGASVTWDHHVTGEPVNLDAMPDVIDERFDAVGTTHADTDAVASVIAALAGGESRLDPAVRDALRAASHWCDHLRPHPALSDDANRVGRGLDAWVGNQLAAAAPGEASSTFARLAAELWRVVSCGGPLPQAAPPAVPDLRASIAERGPVALVDLRGAANVHPSAVYVATDCAVAVVVDDHPNGGLRYTVGVNPRTSPDLDLGPALRALAAAEAAFGPPCRAAEPVPGAENWGGRRTVFGSPWNYGSRLAPEEVAALVRGAVFPPTVRDEEAADAGAFVASDLPYQRMFRVRQSRWRATRGLPVGEHRGAALGSRLPMPFAKETLANYLTDDIRDVVRAEVVHGDRSRGKLYGEPRIYNDLLSSQPLCFNLFAPLTRDLELAGRALSTVLGRDVDVMEIAFEHSPGRGDPAYTGDRSAFDVFVVYRRGPARGFLGLEVKYHEALGDAPSPHRARYDEIADQMGVFPEPTRPRLHEKPLQQIWRDHLLAGSLLHHPDRPFDEGQFVFLFPSENVRCVRAVTAYRAQLAPDCATFTAWTLERVVDALRAAGAHWMDAFATRYLDTPS